MYRNNFLFLRTHLSAEEPLLEAAAPVQVKHSS